MNTGMKKSLNIISIICILLLASCAAKAQKHKGAPEAYYEDLSVVRPAFVNPDTIDPKQAIKNPVAATFPNDLSKKAFMRSDSLAEANKKTTIQGYRILIYKGSSSDESLNVRKQVYAVDSDLNVYTEYKQPSFRVKVGDFIDRVEANYILNDLKINFPNAMIVPDQINLVR